MSDIIITGTIEREGWIDQDKRIYSPKGLAPTLTTKSDIKIIVGCE